MQQALDKVAKKDPVLRADAIVLAARATASTWPAPTTTATTTPPPSCSAAGAAAGTCRPSSASASPRQPTLTVGELDHAYAPPFEVRNYWIAWNGSHDGQEEFTAATS